MKVPRRVKRLMFWPAEWPARRSRLPFRRDKLVRRWLIRSGLWQQETTRG